MALYENLIREEKDGTISFGDYTLETKQKVSDFQHNGDLYKVKTFYEITKLEKN
ncbi:MAG TPA: endosialidase, partial [Lachnoclostridium phytofermentans]|nr:endosialidase [Lachnoclostridium phytofermentans]